MPVQIAGRTWTVTVLPGTAFVANNLARGHWWILLIGLPATAFLGLYLNNLATQRSRAEALVRVRTAELQTSRLQLAQAMDLAHLADWEYDVTTDQYTFDDGFYALYGTTAAREGGHQMSTAAYIRAFVHPDDAPRVAESIAHARRTAAAHQGRQVEHRIVRRDGQVRDIIVHSAAVQDAHGHIVRIYGANQDITERKQAEERLRIEQNNLKAVFACSPVGMLLLDEDTMIVDANSALAHMVSRSLRQIIQQRGGGGLGCVHSLEHEKGCGFAAACRQCPLGNGIARVLRTGTSIRGAEIQPTLSINGQEQRPWLSFSATPVLINGRKHALVAVHDITDRKRAEEELRERTDALQLINLEMKSQQMMLVAQTREMRALLDGMPGHSFLKARNGQYLAANQMFCRALGMTEEAIIGATDFDLFPPELAGKLAADDEQVFSAQTPMLETEDQFVRAQTREWMLTRKIPVRTADGTIDRLIGVSIDITARKVMEEELRAAAHIDKLTDLPNRALLLDRLQQAILRCKRVKDLDYAVLFLDFDRFKNVNDSLGHEVGDRLLCEIAHRLRTALRAADSVGRTSEAATAARLGGDEFVILLTGLHAPGDARPVADRLLEVLSTPYAIGGHELVSTVSIGIVTGQNGYQTADAVLRDADTAMYEAKLAGRGRAVVFDTSMRDRVQRRLELEGGIRKALELGQFVLHYQPIVALENGRIRGFEALVRWNRPGLGMVSPGEFIPVAEETGLIVPLGRWVFGEACRQAAAWCRTFGRDTMPTVSVNLSRQQLGVPDLPAELHAMAQAAGIDPALIHLEVTESAVMGDGKLALELLRQLKARGFKLDMDDFGTGYSSLACLHQFPIDVLKIDRSFIANLDRGRDFAALVNAIATLAGNLGITVVAEGVETEAQVAMLQALECQYAQGFYFARPMPADQAADYMDKALGAGRRRREDVA
jgi:diguanylate cyclase (GGDEF)-like protein/PAS domain S-box-containing protein